MNWFEKAAFKLQLHRAASDAGHRAGNTRFDRDTRQLEELGTIEGKSALNAVCRAELNVASARTAAWHESIIYRELCDAALMDGAL